MSLWTIIIVALLFTLTASGVSFTTTTTLNLPGHGILRGGVTSEGVQCFLGIPFANVTKRWYPASPYNGTWEGERDSTRYGPYCPQIMSGSSTIDSPGAVASEHDCLNLNVYTPDTNSTKLPVMVWIYGGAFTQGANSFYLYDAANVIPYTKNISHPVVIVSINYRLDVLGFLAGNDIAATVANDTSLTGTDKAVGNWGLMDQKLGLEWVKKNIQHFGGDPERVTVYGESAGSISIHYHMLLNRGLFKRAILQSGTINTVPLMPVSDDQPLFDKLLEKYGIDKNLGSQGKVDALRRINYTTLINDANALGAVPLPRQDNVLIHSDTLKQALEFEGYDESIEAVIIGDCKDEGVFFSQFNNLAKPEGYKSYVEMQIPQNLRQEFMSLYPEPQSNDTQDWNALGSSINGDFMFHGPIHLYAKSWAAHGKYKTWYYHFDQPVEAFIKIMADISNNTGLPSAVYHGSDVFPTFFRTGVLTPHETLVAQKLVEYWVRFAYGEDLSQNGWSSFGTGKVLLFGPDPISRESEDSRSVGQMNFYQKYINEILLQNSTLIE
ncbi:alpha/beta-hydrolase [Basidiobolus meristosporus CBS 931.73]|uniref:Carboxylic ester hydrolase n=1 Tax=Basidiobolus meristosporus CBS 931.73 TaxID=1314790 RepID=A0A1Y1ZAQ1_9FUNG|nr:alpha/beta-hydrolase [Basidiobolus meristosporus CBS 931.73]|eukprot:ORY07360.1 alpha/beta-hydrolase [Basidiobolus meristosporus CBS 931.73]